MNIIFYRYNSVCEPDYIEAFRALGVSVIEDMDGADTGKEIKEKVSRLAENIADSSPLFVFSINFFPFVAMLCDRLKVKYVTESVDCPVFEIYNNAIKKEYNRIFLFDKNQYESLSGVNPKGIFYLPLGAPAERTSRLLGDISEYKYDISFVGSLYKEKDPFLKLNFSEEIRNRLENIINEQIQISSFGASFIEENIDSDDIKELKASDSSFYPSEDSVFDLDKYVAVNEYMTPHAAYLERVKLLNSLSEALKYDVHLFTRSDTSDLDRRIRLHGGVKTLEEMPFVFRQSRINLNITMRSIQTGIPQRVWDVLACRGFLITNDQPEIREFFKVGEHLETYKDEQELIEKTQYYMRHEDEREKIAQRGYEEVSSRHTVLKRVISMIQIISASGE